MPCKEVANRRKEKWQTGGREKCHSTAKPSEVVKVWSIRPPSFCVDCVDSVPNLPRPMKIFSKKAPGSFIHKLYGLRSPNSQPSELGNLTSDDEDENKVKRLLQRPMYNVYTQSKWNL